MNTQSEFYPLISSIITMSYSLVSFLGFTVSVTLSSAFAGKCD